ncbi:MAG: FkbM family methyltransferase [Verrucomicrobiota bacterium]|jgi:FkbM family methyltransferase
MKANTRLIFKSLLRRCQVDCVLDIGSCNGSESLLFREIRPKAVAAAFEANPILYKKMAADRNLINHQIEVFPYAISNRNGVAHFHVIDADYGDGTRDNIGISSLLVHEGLKVRETVEVETRRIDEFVLSRYPNVHSVGLWIDVEGAEFEVLEGMAGIKDRVVAVHVETARTPMRVGQKVYAELEVLMKSYGFVPSGTNISGASNWGDVVFVNEKVLENLGMRFHLSRLAGWLSYWGRVNYIGGYLKEHCPPLYRFLSRLYVKLFT